MAICQAALPDSGGFQVILLKHILVCFYFPDPDMACNLIYARFNFELDSLLKYDLMVIPLNPSL